MTSGTHLAEIWRYPVKSMGGEQLSVVDVGPGGILFDRGWSVKDEKAGSVRSARYIPQLLRCCARYLPGTDAGLVPHVEITLPDSTTVCSDDSKVNRRLSDAMGRAMTIWPLQQPDGVARLMGGAHAFETDDPVSELRMLCGLTDDEPLPDFSAMPPGLMKEVMQFGGRRGSFHDAFPIDILTTASLRYLQQYVPDSDLDIRRFRPNLLVDDDGGDSSQLLEREWLGRVVQVGEVQFDVVMECPRCRMVAAEQPGGLVRDSRINRALVNEMRHSISVYCDVRKPGRVAVGDEVHPS